MRGWFIDQRTALQSVKPETLLIQMYMLKVALAFGLGGVVLMGGSGRFSNTTFGGPRDLVDWTGIPAHVIWGLMFLALGTGLIWSVGKPAAVHFLRFGMVVYVFLVITFVVSVVNSPTAALTGVVAYGVFATAHALLSTHLAAYGWK